MKHKAGKKFWDYYNELPEPIQKLANENYALLKSAPRHPSLRFRKVGRFWSVRIGLHYRAVAVQQDDDFVWFWIGHHSEYDRLLGMS